MPILIKKSGYSIAVVGATGAVGTEVFKILSESPLPIHNIVALASERSLGKAVVYKGNTIPVDLLETHSFDDTDIAIFSAGSSISKEYAPKAANAGAIVIDNTSYFRMDKHIPLIVPEVNFDDIKNYTHTNIIANPNCSTIQLVVVLKPLLEQFGLKRIIVSTYQSTSGAGNLAMEELSKQSVGLFRDGSITPEIFPHQIAFNCIPHIDVFEDDGYTKEEKKMILETQKILGKDIAITATCVRVPTFCSHCESVNIEFTNNASVEDIKSCLKKFPGITLQDDPKKNLYPLPINATGKNDVFVGRIRKDASAPNAFNFWIVADDLRKGAALNAVQIAESLVKNSL